MLVGRLSMVLSDILCRQNAVFTTVMLVPTMRSGNVLMWNVADPIGSSQQVYPSIQITPHFVSCQVLGYKKLYSQNNLLAIITKLQSG